MPLASRLFPWAQGPRPHVETPGRPPVTHRRRGGLPPPDQDDTGDLPTVCHPVAFHPLETPWERPPAQRPAPTIEGCLDSLARTRPALRPLLYAIQ
jgi:hypothetical protein